MPLDAEELLARSGVADLSTPKTGKRVKSGVRTGKKTGTKDAQAPQWVLRIFTKVGPRD